MSDYDPDDLVDANKFRDSLLSRADVGGPYPLWHGWALVEAYLAGVQDERDRWEPPADDWNKDDGLLRRSDLDLAVWEQIKSLPWPRKEFSLSDINIAKERLRGPWLSAAKQLVKGFGVSEKNEVSVVKDIDAVAITIHVLQTVSDKFKRKPVLKAMLKNLTGKEYP